MSDDGGDCGGGDSGGGDTGGGDFGCSDGGDYGSNDNGCNSSHDVSISHDNTSHSHADDDRSSHASIHNNHSSTSHCLSTYENAVETNHHTSQHHHDRLSADNQVSAHCTTKNDNDDPSYYYDHQVDLLNSDHRSIHFYDQQNDFDSSTRNVERRYHARPVGYNQMRRPTKFSTNFSIAFGLFLMGLVVLIIFLKS